MIALQRVPVRKQVDLFSALAVTQPHGAFLLRPQFTAGKHLDHRGLLPHIAQVVQRFLQRVLGIPVRDQEAQAFLQAFRAPDRFCQRSFLPVWHRPVQECGQLCESRPSGELRRAYSPPVLQQLQPQPVPASQGQVSDRFSGGARRTPLVFHGGARVQQDHHLALLFLHEQLHIEAVEPRQRVPVQAPDIVSRDIFPVVGEFRRGSGLPGPPATARAALRPASHHQPQRVQSRQKTIC